MLTRISLSPLIILYYKEREFYYYREDLEKLREDEVRSVVVVRSVTGSVSRVVLARMTRHCGGAPIDNIGGGGGSELNSLSRVS